MSLRRMATVALDGGFVMKWRQAALLAGLTLVALSGAAQAATYKFSYETYEILSGSPIQASGTIDAEYVETIVYNVTSMTGLINGSPITSALYGHLFNYATGVNNEAIQITTDGATYEFIGGTISDSYGDLVRGEFTISNVPLPASAPMFGAALLALGAVGYGVKRKRAAAAA